MEDQVGGLGLPFTGIPKGIEPSKPEKPVKATVAEPEAAPAPVEAAPEPEAPSAHKGKGKKG